jgi:NAD(P)H dehydrogenase (quinone)
MPSTVVIYHSGYGHTQRLAQHVADGADAQLIAISAEGTITDAQWADLDAADAIIMGSPTYMGSVSWQFKKFADASSKRWYAGTWKDKLAGGFTCSGYPSGDKVATLQTILTLAMQHGMVWVGLGMMGNETINRLGASLGLMAHANNTTPAEAMHQGDLDTAFAYGQRVAQGAAKLRA